jgi:nicotinamide-nucleotide amidase
LFAKFNRIPTDAQRTQAEQPKGATVLANKVGTASGMWFERGGVVFVSMPGVPFEMQYLMENEVLPRLRERREGLPIVHRTVQTACIGESDVAAIIEQFENALPDFVKLAYLPALSQVRLRLTGIHQDEAFLNTFLDGKVSELKVLLGDHIFGYEKDSLEVVVGRLLRESGKTVGTAESCTGGYIAHLITSVAGSSVYFEGSIVSYSNGIKEKLLGVQPQTLREYGAVSEQTVREMAQNALTVLQTDYALSVSGIAGPDGGTPDKPVGTIWYALACADGRIVTEKLKFGRDRHKNIHLTSVYILNHLRKFIR